MLVVELALHWIDCNSGNYFDFDENVCIPISTCLGKGKFIYNETCVCDNKYPPVTTGDNRVHKNSEGMYFCPTGSYLLLDDGQGTCVSEITHHNYLYLKEDKHIYMRSAWVCNEYLKSYAYNVSGQVLCLFAEDCWGRTGFIWYDYCYTPRQYRLYGQSYAYMAFKGCRQNPPD